MKLRYHNTDLPNGRCLSILSMPPQQRTIYTAFPYRRSARVWFPHTIFVFQYARVPGGFVYYGIYGGGRVRDPGLHVYTNDTPLQSFDDVLSGSPTEHNRFGQACTDHAFDYKVFKNPRLLMGTVLNSWWSTPHICDDGWLKMSLDEVLRYCVTGQEMCPPIRTSLRRLLPPGVRDQIIDQPLGKLPYKTKQDFYPNAQDNERIYGRE